MANAKFRPTKSTSSLTATTLQIQAFLDTIGGFDRKGTACVVLDKVPASNVVDLVDIAGPDGIRLNLSPEQFGSCMQRVITSSISFGQILTLVLPCYIGSKHRRELGCNIRLGSRAKVKLMVKSRIRKNISPNTSPNEGRLVALVNTISLDEPLAD